MPQNKTKVDSCKELYLEKEVIIYLDIDFQLSQDCQFDMLMAHPSTRMESQLMPRYEFNHEKFLYNDERAIAYIFKALLKTLANSFNGW